VYALQWPATSRADMDNHAEVLTSRALPRTSVASTTGGAYLRARSRLAEWLREAARADIVITGIG